MVSRKLNFCFLSGNALKIIAALSMLTDHVGHLLLPEFKILRIIGRIAFPIFAFMIAESCNYTKNRLRYFLTVFSLAVVCQTSYYIFDGSLDMGILVTFSLSILVIYALQNVKAALYSSMYSFVKRFLAFSVFILTVAAVYILNEYLVIDYGFWGSMVPAFANLFRQTDTDISARLKKPDCITVHVLMLGVGLIVLSASLGGIQYYSLFAIPLLLLYSGERGKWKMKSFFYIFYPAHLVVLQCIYMMTD